MTEKKIWSMDELVALTDEVQIDEVVFRDKLVEFQFCELVEAEEPKLKSQDGMSEEEKMGYYQELGSQRVFKMIEKANEKNPDDIVIFDATNGGNGASELIYNFLFHILLKLG